MAIVKKAEVHVDAEPGIYEKDDKTLEALNVPQAEAFVGDGWKLQAKKPATAKKPAAKKSATDDDKTGDANEGSEK